MCTQEFKIHDPVMTMECGHRGHPRCVKKVFEHLSEAKKSLDKMKENQPPKKNVMISAK